MIEKLKIKEIYDDFKSKIMLTERQSEILELLLRDKSITQISMELCICERTISYEKREINKLYKQYTRGEINKIVNLIT